MSVVIDVTPNSCAFHSGTAVMAHGSWLAVYGHMGTRYFGGGVQQAVPCFCAPLLPPLLRRARLPARQPASLPVCLHQKKYTNPRSLFIVPQCSKPCKVQSIRTRQIQWGSPPPAVLMNTSCTALHLHLNHAAMLAALHHASSGLFPTDASSFTPEPSFCHPISLFPCAQLALARVCPQLETLTVYGAV